MLKSNNDNIKNIGFLFFKTQLDTLNLDYVK